MVMNFLVFLGFALIGCELWALAAKPSLQEVSRDLPHYKTLNIVNFVVWVIGCLLALATVTVWWPYSRDARILGAPFPAVVFERSGDAWLDFVGPLSGPLLIADFIIVFFLPQFVFTVYLRRITRNIDPPESNRFS